MKICRVACGDSHVLCLAEDDKVYSWGANDCSQLGLGSSSTLIQRKPKLVPELAGIPIAQISAGGKHSFALSKTGHVYCWGSNKFGQLGFENSPNKSNYEIRNPAKCVEMAQTVSCGENHTAFLTLDGLVYTCGSGASGQLGYYPREGNQFIPRKIEELKNNPASILACGRDCTIVFIESTNKFHYYGAKGNCVINLPNGLDGTIPSELNGTILSGMYARILSGLDARIRSVLDDTKLKRGEDEDEKCSGFESLTLDMVMSMMSKQQGEDCDKEIKDKLSRTLSQATCVNRSFKLKNSGEISSESCHGIDFDAAGDFFNEVRRQSYYGIAEQALKTLMRSLLSKTISTDGLSMFLLLPCCLYEKSSALYCEDLVVSMSNLINGFQKEQNVILEKWSKNISTHHFMRCVSFFRKCVKRNLSRLPDSSDILATLRMHAAVESCIKVLNMLNEVNKQRCKPIPFNKFYINNLFDVVNITGDCDSRLEDIKNQKPSEFRFCKYPFMYDPASKDILLKHRCNQNMARNAIQFLVFTITEANVLKVRRNHLVKDTHERLSLKKKDLCNKLKVLFEEESDESGDGIRQEFFQLLIEELLDEKSEACCYEADSNLQWFLVKGEEEGSNLADIRFIGLICGLALYNGVTLHLQFPSALYKKLLDKPVSFEDLFDLMPVHHKSMEELLDYREDDIEGLCFHFAHPVEFCPNGEDIPVNHSNKEEYVEKVIDYYLNKRVQKEFESFREGFYTAMPKAFLKCFQPKELEEVLVGNEKYDFKAMEKNVVYANDYHKDHETIVMFWEVFHNMELQDKKDFLKFLTGTHRIPAYGMNRLKIRIAPQNEDPDKILPLGMTCDKTLWLPRYTNKESLEKNLRLVLQVSGFGLDEVLSENGRLQRL